HYLGGHRSRPGDEIGAAMSHNVKVVSYVAVTLLAAGCLTGCQSNKPAVCDGVYSLKSSVSDLKNGQLGQGALNTLFSDVSKVQADVQQLTKDAKSQFGDEASKVKSSASALQSSIDAAKSNPSTSTLAAVGTAIQGFSSSVSTLDNAVKNTC